MSHTDRIISLIDMDCFYCQVEERLDPNLVGKPIAVVQYNQWRGGGIIAVNYLAREKGVTRQMRGDEAKERCPNIELPRVPQVRQKADLTKYREAGKQVAEVLMTFTDILERASIDEAYLDLTEAVNRELKNGFPIIGSQDLCNTFIVGQETPDFLAAIHQNRDVGFYEDDLKLAVGALIVERIRAEVYDKTGTPELYRIYLTPSEHQLNRSGAELYMDDFGLLKNYCPITCFKTLYKIKCLKNRILEIIRLVWNLVYEQIGCIDENQGKLLDRLREAIGLPLSTNAEKSHSVGIIEWTDKLLKSLGFFTELKHGEYESYDGSCLPSVIFGSSETGHCPNKSTILIYCQLGFTGTQNEDTLINDRQKDTSNNFYGNGILHLSSVIAWLNTIEAFKILGIDNPVNIKFIIAPMETESSLGFNNLLVSQKNGFLDEVDYVCMNEGSWLQADSPGFVKKLKGLCYFSIEVQCSMKNMEGTKWSGIIRDAMKDLLYLIGSLIDEEGNLRMSELNMVAEELSEEEISLYMETDLDIHNFMNSVGAKCLLFNGDKSEIIKHRLIFPTLTIHGIDSSLKDITEWSMPSRATAKLSIRTFHNNIAEIFECVNNYLRKCWSLRGCNNKLIISRDKIYETWNADVDNVHYKVAAKATQYVYHKPLHLLNNDYTIPVVNMLQDIVGKNILLLPIISEECYMNEIIPNNNYLNASKMFASYLYEMGEIPILASKSSISFVSCESLPEICVCGKIEEGFQAASGDSENSRPDPTKPNNISDVENKCICPHRTQVRRVLSDDLMPKNILSPIVKPCECTLEHELGNVEKGSLVSLASTASRDPSPLPKLEEKEKKNDTPSIDTIHCACVPNRYRAIIRKEENIISPEQKDLLTKSMRSIRSEISGLSSGEYSGEKFITPRMKILGCVCPEKSQESVYDIEIQRNRMFCPVTNDKSVICNQGGIRRHHVAGPPIMDEEDGEVLSLGPLSHCSCSQESITLLPNCDCPKSPAEKKWENTNDEID